MSEAKHIGSLVGFAMASMASDETARESEAAPRSASLVERRNALLSKSQHRKRVTAFRATRSRSGASRSGPCVGCPRRRRCTSACAEFDSFVGDQL